MFDETPTAEQRPEESLVGAEIDGRYRIESLIGRGGMGAAYRGRQLSTDRTVVVKIPQLRHVDGEDVVARFVREVRQQLELTEVSGIATVFDVGTWRERPYLVMEHLPGGSLADRLLKSGQRIPPEALFPWVEEVATTLDRLHARTPPVLHRDIDPRNILFTSDDEARVSDLGIAMTVGTSRLTRSGAVTGKRGYIPPEAFDWDPEQWTGAYDQYQLASTVVRALMGTLTARSVTLPGVDERIRGVVARARSDLPADRYRTCTEFASALRNAVRAAGGAAMVTTADPSAPPPPRRDPDPTTDGESATRTGTPVLAAAEGMAAAARRETASPSVSSSSPTDDTGGRRLALALLLAGVVGAIGLAVFRARDDAPVDPSTAAPVAASGALLSDVKQWDEATSHDRRSAAELVAARLPAFTLRRLATFGSGDATREIAVFAHPATGLEFALVPGGTFAMGSPPSEPGRYDDETRRSVTIADPFLLCTTECTQAAWERAPIVRARTNAFAGPDLPVESVSWDEARAWCEALELRLPTESEWEWACRATTSTPWSFGSERTSIGQHGNVIDAAIDREFVEDRLLYPSGRLELTRHTLRYEPETDIDDGAVFTAPVGRYSPNAFGLRDMHGNVWEWCQDWYGAYHAAPSDGTAQSEPSREGQRVSRGGSWLNRSQHARSAYRNRTPPDSRNEFNGFRPACSIPLD